MVAVLVIIHSLICVLLIVLILMHSGKDAGLSGAFGVGGSSSAYGGSSAIGRSASLVSLAASCLPSVT